MKSRAWSASLVGPPCSPCRGHYAHDPTRILFVPNVSCCLLLPPCQLTYGTSTNLVQSDISRLTSAKGNHSRQPLGFYRHFFFLHPIPSHLILSLCRVCFPSQCLSNPMKKKRKTTSKWSVSIILPPAGQGVYSNHEHGTSEDESGTNNC